MWLAVVLGRPHGGGQSGDECLDLGPGGLWILGGLVLELGLLGFGLLLRLSCELGAALSPLVGLGLDLGVVVSLGLGLGILLLEGPVGGGDLLGSQGRAVRSWCGSVWAWACRGIWARVWRSCPRA